MYRNEGKDQLRTDRDKSRKGRNRRQVYIGCSRRPAVDWFELNANKEMPAKHRSRGRHKNGSHITASIPTSGNQFRE